MISITTKYIAPTNTRGARVKATLQSGKSISIPWKHEHGIEENHNLAAIALLSKLGRVGEGIKLYRGTAKGMEGNVYVMKWHGGELDVDTYHHKEVQEIVKRLRKVSSPGIRIDRKGGFNR